MIGRERKESMEEEKEKMPRKRKKNKGEMKKKYIAFPSPRFLPQQKTECRGRLFAFLWQIPAYISFFLGVFALFSLPSCHGEMRRKEGKKKDGQNSFAPS